LAREISGLAAQGTAAVIGEPTGGWFWLPPWLLWQRWAKQGLAMLAANCMRPNFNE